MEKRKNRKLTRRQFVQQSVEFSLAATALSACSTLGVGRGPAEDGSAGGTFSDTTEYIVIGSGAGGGPVAANLAKNGKRVLLIEAGVDAKSPNYEIPSFNAFATEDPSMCWNFYVNHYAHQGQMAKSRRDSKYVDGKGVLYPRAGTLGGCTAHNAMVTLYPDNQDWDDIVQLTGDSSWSPDAMRDYYRRVENKRYGTSLTDGFERRGDKGWLSVEQNSFKFLLEDLVSTDHKLNRILLAACGAKEVNPFDVGLYLANIHDPNDWSYVRTKLDGVFNIPKATLNGTRNGTRELLLNTAAQYPTNLTIKTGAYVTRILLDETKRAVGVEYLESSHVYRADPSAAAHLGAGAVYRRVKASKEVILAGGAFNSPQLLMLSGIGPEEQLKRHGIPVRVNLPGVGQNLQDRYEVGVVSELKTPFEFLDNCTFGADNDPCLADYKNHPTSSTYSSNGPMVSVIRRSDPSMASPDVVVFALPGRFRGYYPNWSKDVMTGNYLTWAVLKGHTKNRSGTVSLRSADPLDTPEINFNYFNDGSDEDLNAILKGIEAARDMNGNDLLKSIIAREVVPAVDGDELKDFVRRETWGHHASCTNKMGGATDEMAVLDSKFRVRGTKGLRVVDASVFPRVPGLFIVVPIYMIAEKASDDILKEADQK